METLRRHNSSLPRISGQVVTASVLQINDERVLLDPHFHGISELPRRLVDASSVHIFKPQALPTPSGTARGAEAATPAPAPPRGVSPGDTLRLRVGLMYTPYGDMELHPIQRDLAVKTKMVWSELVSLFRRRRMVGGRVLNSCPGGYAVGLGGGVALLPYANCTPETTYNIGTLQQFDIERMDTTNPPRSDLIILRDARLPRSSRHRPSSGQ